MLERFKRYHIEHTIKSLKRQINKRKTLKEPYNGLLSKTTRNEIRKIHATYYNNVAIGIAVAGYFISTLTILPKNIEANKKDSNAGQYDGSAPAEIAIPLIVAFLALALASRCRALAVSRLQSTED